jgi:hypothetical protein
LTFFYALNPTALLLFLGFGGQINKNMEKFRILLSPGPFSRDKIINKNQEFFTTFTYKQNVLN